MRRTDPLIVGGGPAGAAAGIALAAAGFRPLILDRNRAAPDQLCGGFLGWDAIASLKALGVDPLALGARPITRMRLIAGATVVEAPLPHPAAGLSRRTLDAALLARATATGAGMERSVIVREVAAGSVRLADGTQLTADAAFLATGKHDVAGSDRPRAAQGDDPAMGRRTRFAPSPALAAALDGVIELHLFPGGYAGLLLQEDGAANLCMSLATSLFAAGDLAETLAARAPRLADRLAALPAASTWQAVARVPYGWRTRAAAPGLFRIGDQAAVIASLAGDGVAIAVASGTLGARRYAAGGPGAAPDFQGEFARLARRPLAVAGALRRRAESPHAESLLGWLGRIPALPALLARLTRIGSPSH